MSSEEIFVNIFLYSITIIIPVCFVSLLALIITVVLTLNIMEHRGRLKCLKELSRELELNYNATALDVPVIFRPRYMVIDGQHRGYFLSVMYRHGHRRQQRKFLVKLDSQIPFKGNLILYSKNTILIYLGSEKEFFLEDEAFHRYFCLRLQGLSLSEANSILEMDIKKEMVKIHGICEFKLYTEGNSITFETRHMLKDKEIVKNIVKTLVLIADNCRKVAINERG